MAAVEVRGLVKRFGGGDGTVAIDDLNFDLEDGQFLVILGPSGCGKTTTLRCLAGLEAADAGTIKLRHEVVVDAARRISRPPEKRNIGMVFQSYALWPNMTVRRNLEYPLKARRLQNGLAEGWVEEIAKVVECGDLLNKYPGQLSGGQQQRVALARGLISRPDLVLFDEPLSNLDARLRDSVRAELHLLHRRLQFTAVYVTHDQEEAFALADQLMIMRAGRVEQVGTPIDVYRNPATDYVAEFIGMSNKLTVERVGSQCAIAGHHVGDHWSRTSMQTEPFYVRLRPEDVEVVASPEAITRSDVIVPATFVDGAFGVRSTEVTVMAGDATVVASLPSVDGFEKFGDTEPGTTVWIAFRSADAAVFDAVGNAVRGQISSRETGPRV